MMTGDLLRAHIHAILDSAEILLRESDGALTPKQVQALKRIIASAEGFLVVYAECPEVYPGEFFVKMRFEIGTMLTPIRGYAELMLMGVIGPLTARQWEHIETILTSADKLRDSIDLVVDKALASAAV